MHPDIPMGSFVVIDQFLDFTKCRPGTFFEGENGLVHIDMTEPYCPEIRKSLIEGCERLNIKHFNSGVYVCTEGPRFENKAEINMFRILGGDVVGMTNFPEVVLAREVNLCYAAVGMVTNYCTGISDSPLTHKEVIDNMNLMSRNIRELLLLCIGNIPEIRKCECKNATKELGSLK
jgi:5'-methylthioadenosine phosphorylase